MISPLVPTADWVVARLLFRLLVVFCFFFSRPPLLLDPASYAEENRDLEEDDDDVPVRRTTQQASSAVATDDATDEEATHKLTLRIQHAVGAGPFTPRGQVTLNYNPSKRAGGKAITFTPSQKVPRKELAALLRQSTDGSLLYRVEFLLAVGSSIVASVPACALVASHMHENFVFHADPYGTLVGVTYRTPITDCLSASEQAKVLAGDADAYFQTKGKVSFGRPGEKAKLHVRPGFDASAQAAAQAVGSETPTPAATANVERNADGTPVPPPQSFWQKYWIYM